MFLGSELRALRGRGVSTPAGLPTGEAQGREAGARPQLWKEPRQGGQPFRPGHVDLGL